MSDERSRSFGALLLILRGLAAVVAGEATMVVLITLVQENLFGGVSFTKSSTSILLMAGALTFLAAAMGGFVAGWIAKGFPMLPAVILAAEVPVETTYLIVSGKTIDPVWFDIMAAGSLVVGILLGAYCHVVFGSASGSKLGMCPKTTSCGKG